MRAVDLFAGCGGLSLGLQQAGIQVVAAYDNWKPAIQLYECNFDHPIHDIDLADVENAKKHIEAYSPQLIAGGPPCQDFSSAGKRNEFGGRGELTVSFAKIIAGISPEWFIMENVERTLKTKTYIGAKSIFKNAGYGLTEVVLDASYCGVPQIRKRLFLIGKLGEQDDFLLSVLLSGLSDSRMSIRDYMGDELEIDYYYRHARSYQRRGIFSVDEPSPTIRGVNRPIPPNYQLHDGDVTADLSIVRPLTTYERSRIQTFPKSYDLCLKSKTDLEQAIGNAVPVNLSSYIGQKIISYTNNARYHVKPISVFEENNLKSN